MKSWQKYLLTLSLSVAMTVIGIGEYYFYKSYFESDLIGPTMNQVYMDFEFELYRNSSGNLLLNDYVIKKEVISDDRVRYELLVDYKKNPLAFSVAKISNQPKKIGSQLERQIIYYKMVDEQWIKSNI